MERETMAVRLRDLPAEENIRIVNSNATDPSVPVMVLTPDGIWQQSGYESGYEMGDGLSRIVEALAEGYDEIVNICDFFDQDEDEWRSYISAYRRDNKGALVKDEDLAARIRQFLTPPELEIHRITRRQVAARLEAIASSIETLAEEVKVLYDEVTLRGERDWKEFEEMNPLEAAAILRGDYEPPDL